MLNKIFLQGRLVADPELRHTQSGVAVASFRLAVDRDFKDRETGERKADFFNVVAWRQTGEFVSRFLAKGRLALVEGTLQNREYAAPPPKWWPATSISPTLVVTMTMADMPPNPAAAVTTTPLLAAATTMPPPPTAAAIPRPAAVTPQPPRWISSLTSPMTTVSCPSKGPSARRTDAPDQTSRAVGP